METYVIMQGINGILLTVSLFLGGALLKNFISDRDRVSKEIKLNREETRKEISEVKCSLNQENRDTDSSFMQVYKLIQKQQDQISQTLVLASKNQTAIERNQEILSMHITKEGK